MQLTEQKQEGNISVYEEGEKVKESLWTLLGSDMYSTLAFSGAKWNVRERVESLASEVRESGPHLGFLVNCLYRARNWALKAPVSWL